MKAQIRSLALVAVLVIQLACGGGDLIKSFRVALAASGPLVNSLVASGAIPQSRATAILRDFDDGAACAQSLQNAFKLIPKGDPDETSRKLTASSNALQCFRVIINRQNFAAHPRIQQAADIAEAVLASLVAFYSGSNMGAAGAAPKSEDDLEKELKQKVKDLEQALKP